MPDIFVGDASRRHLLPALRENTKIISKCIVCNLRMSANTDRFSQHRETAMHVARLSDGKSNPGIEIQNCPVISKPDLTHRLGEIVSSSRDLMAALHAVRALGLSSWCIGAGAVRSLVWDTLHGYGERTAVEDIDVVYFDADADPAQDARLEARLHSMMPGPAWEVTNQAHVHHWFATALGQAVPPLASLEEGVGTWPEFATCVGVCLNADDSLGVVAPHGLGDLFALQLRHNPLKASAATYRQRIESKRFGERWPLLTMVEA